MATTTSPMLTTTSPMTTGPTTTAATTAVLFYKEVPTGNAEVFKIYAGSTK